MWGDIPIRWGKFSSYRPRGTKVRFNPSNQFLERVKGLKKRLHIQRIKQGRELYRRRIAIAVQRAYLRTHGGIHQAYFLEADVYHLLKEVNLACGPLPEERRLEGFNRLKLVSEGKELETKEPFFIAKEIMGIFLLLSEWENKDGEKTKTTGRKNERF